MNELRGDCDQGMIEQYFEQELLKAKDILPRWDGGTVRMWAFDQELFTMTLRIEKQSKTGNLTIVCDAPIAMSGPFEWNDSEVRVTRDKQSFLVSDAKASFTLRATVVDVTENCDPLNVIFNP